MTRRRGPTKRLLILPALLIVALLAGVHAIRGTDPRTVDPTMRVADVPALAGEALRCTRSDDASTIREIRRQVDPAGRVSSEMVLACPAAYDGQQVRYVGELVGDLLAREGGAWVMVNDDDYALELGPLGAHQHHRGTNSGLTAWLPDELLTATTGVGRPDQRGDVVELRGRIVRTDPDDGGGLTLRAESLAVLSPAVPVTEPFAVPQALLALGAVMTAVALWIVRRRADRL